MTAEFEGRAVSGKRVVVIAVLMTILFTVGMGFGTYYFANWLTPILRSRAAKAEPVKTAPSAPASAPANR